MVGVDRRPVPCPPAAVVAGDVRVPPVAHGAWDLVVLPNLVRHLLADAAPALPWETWWALLADRGELVVLEDRPLEDPGPAGHYTRLQAFLAGLPGRGPLLGRKAFRRLLAPGPFEVVDSGTCGNSYGVDADAVVALLRSGQPDPGSEADELAAAIARDGISLGDYWWARIARKGTG